MSSARRLILASTSRYRAELLARLGLPFDTIAPGVAEIRQAGEAPDQFAVRLARAKALASQASQPHAIVIGSDQVLSCNDEILGKPGDHAHAVGQLRHLSGQTAHFYTAVCIADHAAHRQVERLVHVEVRFRTLSETVIERYLRAETPYDCAGSAKAEGLGIALIAQIDSSDPTALIGLPLIAVVDLLSELGVSVFDALGASS